MMPNWIFDNCSLIVHVVSYRDYYCLGGVALHNGAEALEEGALGCDSIQTDKGDFVPCNGVIAYFFDINRNFGLKTSGFFSLRK